MNKKKPKIGIIGLGTVGEPLRKWFEEILGYKRGKDLFCYDIDPKKGYFDDINKGEIIFVCVPTPSKSDGRCNTSIVEEAVRSIKDGKIVVIKSTVQPGTVLKLQNLYPKKRIIFNPEFLTESQAWIDFIRPDRQIVATTIKSYRDAYEILDLLPKSPFVRPWSSDYIKKAVNSTEAELAKYASNVFGYMKVVFGNIIADLCYGLSMSLKKEMLNSKVDYENVREIISADPRIGPAWLNVEHGNYCGVGGYCFPKDMDAFIRFIEDLIKDLSKDKNIESGLISALKGGVNVLKAISNYNKIILTWQGLSKEDVTKHNHEIVIKKRKQIRKI